MFTWKKFLLITVAAAVVGIGSAFGWSYYQANNFNNAAQETINTEAPDITVTAMDGTQLKLSDLRGKTVFVNFWATWCGPCMLEMPEMNKIYPDYKDKIEFFSVSIDDAKADYEKYTKESSFAFPMYWGDKNAIIKDYALQGIPASYIVDKHGTIIHSHIGAMNEQQLRDFLNKVQ